MENEIDEVYVSQRCLTTMLNHVSENPYNEMGGFIVGRVFNFKIENRLVTYAHDAVPAKDVESFHTQVRIKPHSFLYLNEFLDDFRNKHGEYSLITVGWYHSHPFNSPTSIFLSSNDYEIINESFKEFYHISVVLDPRSRSRGLYGWRSGEHVRFVEKSFIVEDVGEILNDRRD